MKRLGHKFRKWNWDIFGDLKYQLKRLKNQIEEHELRSQTNWIEKEDANLELLKLELTIMDEKV